MFNSPKFLLILLLIIPFPSLSNSLFQKIDIKLKNNIVLNNKNNIEKKLFNILDFNSKYVVNFWATWCIPCKKELPDLKKMKIDHKDLKVIIISIDKKSIKDQLNFLTKNVRHRLTFENRTAKIRNCLTKFTCIFEIGAVQRFVNLVESCRS